MATKCLTDIVNSLINPISQIDTEEPLIITTAELVPNILSDLLRDVPLRTSQDMMLWVIAAHSNCSDITATITRVRDAKEHLYSLGSLWDVQSMDVFGLFAEFKVIFSGMMIMAVEYRGSKISCDELEFHEGDFTVRSCGKQVGHIPGVW